MPLKPVQVSYWVDYSGAETDWTETRARLKRQDYKSKDRLQEYLRAQFSFVLHICKLQNIFSSTAQGKYKQKIKKQTRITTQLLNCKTTRQKYAFELKCTTMPDIYLSLKQERKRRQMIKKTGGKVYRMTSWHFWEVFCYLKKGSNNL